MKIEEDKRSVDDFKKPLKLCKKLVKNESNVNIVGLQDAKHSMKGNDLILVSNSSNDPSKTYSTSSAQNNVSSLDLEGLDDPIMLKETNDAMKLDLQARKTLLSG